MKQPTKCSNINDIRSAIDEIDLQIIKLIAQRAAYVQKAAEFKTDKNSVKAPDRVKSMLAKRREWAELNHIDPDFIENLFSNLVEYFISKEMKTWQNEQK
jgi:isochorismate pyruvate lyase